MALRIWLISLLPWIFVGTAEARGADARLAEQLRRLPPAVVFPGASLALGSTSAGSLEGGVVLPRNMPTLRVLKATRRRGLDSGHGRLVRALERVSQRVAARHSPPAPLWVGNMAAIGGGKIPYSRSHQTGLDTDLVIPVVPRGQGAPTPGIRPVRAPHEALDDRPLMDVPRTWMMVEELLQDPEIDLLWIFLSDPLIDALLDYAVHSHAPAWLVGRAAHILHQPSDSLPHDDHLHVRVGCGAPDLLAGCQNSRPIWPWSKRYQETVTSLVLGDLRGALAGWRDLKTALRAVLRTHTVAALPYAFLLMADPERDVRVLGARTVDALHRPHLFGAGLAGLLEDRGLAKVEARALQRCAGPLCSLRVVQLLNESRGCRGGRTARVRVWLEAIIREPHDSAVEALAGCATRLRDKMEIRMVKALARIAGRPVPPGKVQKAAEILLQGIRAAPEDRLQRLWQEYIPDGAWHRAAETHLRSGLFGGGVDAMNRRELFEMIMAYPRRTNLLSRKRRVRLWKNRLAALDAAFQNDLGESGESP